MHWDLNEGRYTCILVSGFVAHAVRTPVGWEVLVPGANVHEILRNNELRTWLTARPVVERLLRARLR